MGIAFLMMLVGLSPALGTFVAGVVLANSEFRHQLEADLKPFKGLLLGLFFMTVGVGINFAMLAREPFVVLGLTLGLIMTKAFVLMALSFAFRLRGKGVQTRPNPGDLLVRLMIVLPRKDDPDLREFISKWPGRKTEIQR